MQMSKCLTAAMTGYGLKLIFMGDSQNLLTIEHHRYRIHSFSIKCLTGTLVNSIEALILI